MPGRSRCCFLLHLSKDAVKAEESRPLFEVRLEDRTLRRLKDGATFNQEWLLDLMDSLEENLRATYTALCRSVDLPLEYDFTWEDDGCGNIVLRQDDDKALEIWRAWQLTEIVDGVEALVQERVDEWRELLTR